MGPSAGTSSGQIAAWQLLYVWVGLEFCHLWWKFRYFNYMSGLSVCAAPGHVWSIAACAATECVWSFAAHAAPKLVCSTAAWDACRCVCATAVCAASGHICLTAACAPPGRYSSNAVFAVPGHICVSFLQYMYSSLYWPRRCLSFCFTWMYLFNSSLWCARRWPTAAWGTPELPVFKSQCCTESCLSTRAFVCTWVVCWHLCVSVYKSFVLHLEVSVFKSLCCTCAWWLWGALLWTWACLSMRVLCYSWTFLSTRAQCMLYLE